MHIHSSFPLNMYFSCLNCCVLPYWYLYVFISLPSIQTLTICKIQPFITFAFVD